MAASPSASSSSRRSRSKPLGGAAAERLAVMLRWACSASPRIAAACVTPYGPELILVTRRILGLGPALALIGEWQPQDFAQLAGFKLCLLAGIGFALYRGLTLPPIRLLVLLGLVHMGAGAQRATANARPLGALVHRRAAWRRSSGARSRRSAAQMLAGARVDGCADRGQPGAAAGAFLRAACRDHAGAGARRLEGAGNKHILNSYDFGGYLIFHHVKPFIDGRTELYGGSSCCAMIARCGSRCRRLPPIAHRIPHRRHAACARHAGDRPAR